MSFLSIATIEMKYWMGLAALAQGLSGMQKVRGRVKLKSLIGGKSEMIPGRDSREKKSLVVVVYHTAI